MGAKQIKQYICDMCGTATLAGSQPEQWWAVSKVKVGRRKPEMLDWCPDCVGAIEAVADARRAAVEDALKSPRVKADERRKKAKETKERKAAEQQVKTESEEVTA